MDYANIRDESFVTSQPSNYQEKTGFFLEKLCYAEYWDHDICFGTSAV
jgi:hypothetical protein